MVLATEEKALLAFEPTRRIVPTTKTKITASITILRCLARCRLSKLGENTHFSAIPFNRENSDFRLAGYVRQPNSEPDSTGRLCSGAHAVSIGKVPAFGSGSGI